LSTPMLRVHFMSLKLHQEIVRRIVRGIVIDSYLYTSPVNLKTHFCHVMAKSVT
jgi:hypothetical protein